MTCKDHNPLPASLSSLSPFFVPHPTPITSWGQGEEQQPVCPLAVVPPGSEAGPTPGSHSKLRAGLLLAPIRWGQPGEGHASGRAAQGWEVAGPALLLDTRVPPLPAHPPRAPARNTTFWTLWVETASAWTVARGTPPSWRPPGSSAVSSWPVTSASSHPSGS